MRKIGLFFTCVALSTGQVYATNAIMNGLFFDCKSLQQPSKQLGGYTEGSSIIKIYQQSKQLYILHRLPKSTGNNCSKSSCIEWSNKSANEISDLVSLWYDPYLHPDEGYLKISHSDGVVENFICPIDA